MSTRFFVSDLCHVDLGWKRDGQEMTELFEIYILRMLDMLDQNPDYKASVEQAYHLRRLAERRPDLFSRLKAYVAQGCVEVLGAMISTMETNLPCAEAFVRNQLLGLDWTAKVLGTAPTTAWLIDTFGLHPQIPQLLTQFGFVRLMANRFGGVVPHRAFWAKGLDGSRICIVGRDVHAAHTDPKHLVFGMVRDWAQVDDRFAEAEAMSGQEPVLVAPYIENEEPLLSRALLQVRRRNRQGDDRWTIATTKDFFAAFHPHMDSLPEISGDLNPEFTATFSQRICLKLRNRQAENRLLCTEQWAALCGLQNTRPALEDAWWTMGFVQFHDTFTGSHPTRVMNEVLAALDDVERVCEDVMTSILPQGTDPGTGAPVCYVFNPSPFARQERLCFVHQSQEYALDAQVDAGGIHRFSLDCAQPVVAPSMREVESVCLKNRHLSITLTKRGIASFRTAGGTDLLRETNGLLVLQQDTGSFQIESPTGAEIGPDPHTQRLITDSAHIAELSGAFPGLPWMAGKHVLDYRLRFTVQPDSTAAQLDIFLHWRGESGRVRLRLDTAIDAAAAVFEVPFGTHKRGSYGVRATAKGEWPAQRFVALEDVSKGLALINRGTAGVEVQSSSLLSTLLRAPHSEYAGMVPDDTSSQHGEHHFSFLLQPYDGTWVEADVARAAQAFNSPMTVAIADVEAKRVPSFSLTAAHVLMACMKFAQDASGDLIVRLYETAGTAENAVFRLADAEAAWDCGIMEQNKNVLPCTQGCVSVDLEPFEIKTLRIRRK